MVITGVYGNVFENSDRYTGQVNIGVVASSNGNSNSVLLKVMDRSQPVHFLTIARRSFASEQEAENYVNQKKQEIEAVIKDLETDFTQNARLVTFTSDKPIRTRNQKRFGVPADHNKFGDRYVIRRVYHKELHGEFAQYLETVLGTVPEDHEIRENGERITVLLHSAVNVENADKVVADLVDLVEDQEVA